MGTDPVLATPSDAIAALEQDLPKVLRGRSLEEVGWRRLDDLTILVPVKGTQANETADDYLLRLCFAYYPDWPPSAQFVNPVTLSFDAMKDKCWLPKIEGTNEIHVHASYSGNARTVQLICCSVTLEFYLVRHGLKSEHLWNYPEQNFSATINQIEWALKSQFYKGRQDVLPPRG